MTLQDLLKQIEDTQEKIKTLDNLRDCYAKQDATLRSAGISFRGNYTVYFMASEVDDLLEQRHVGLHVQLNRLLAAKDAAEKTATGWMHEPQRT